jgi:hypothetical protein
MRRAWLFGLLCLTLAACGEGVTGPKGDKGDKDRPVPPGLRGPSVRRVLRVPRPAERLFA